MPETRTGKKWWHDGVQFTCQGSGRCCVSRGTYGYVYMTLEDRRRMAAELRMPTWKFTRQYCDKTDGNFHLRDTGPDCMFLEDKRCKVYEGRPTQCRTWPFWAENMGAKGWAAVAEFCPGVGSGRVVPREEIEISVTIQRRSDRQS